MELFYAIIHVTHLIHWLKLKKTLRKTSVLAYLECDLIKNKGGGGGGGVHFALYTESFLKLSKIFLKNYLSKPKHLLAIFLKGNCSRSFKIFPKISLSQWALIKLQIIVCIRFVLRTLSVVQHEAFSKTS